MLEEPALPVWYLWGNRHEWKPPLSSPKKLKKWDRKGNHIWIEKRPLIMLGDMSFLMGSIDSSVTFSMLGLKALSL